MQYKKLYDEFKNLFPEDAVTLDKLARYVDAEPNDGMHIMFGFVVVPFILKLVSNNEEDKLNRAFLFFEEMAKSENSLISEVLEFSVLEDLISRDEEVYNKLKAFMGAKTLNSCESLESYYQ